MRRSLLAALCAGTCVAGLAVPAAAANPSAPGPARQVRAASISTSSLTLSWTNPGGKAFKRTVVRMRHGATAPASPKAGKRVASLGKSRHSLKVRHLAAGSQYTFAVFAGDGHGHFARAATIRTGTRTAAPAGPRAYEDTSSTVLRWTNPHGAARVVVRYTKGTAAPTSTARGAGVRLSSARPSSARLSGLAADTRYAASVFAVDRFGRASYPAVVRFTSPSTATDKDATYSGRVVDRTGAPLLNADAYAFSYEDGTEIDTVTDSDGRFGLDLPAGHWYIGASGERATGGDADATGYQYDAVDVDLQAGQQATAARSLTLLPGAVLTGRITDSAGTPLAGAAPYVAPVDAYVSEDFSMSLFLTSYGDTGVRTGADGTFTMRGLPGDSALRVCASADRGSVDPAATPTPYLNRCSARSVLLTTGASTAAADLRLRQGSGGTVAGTVSDTAGVALTTGSVSVVYASGENAGWEVAFGALQADGTYSIDAVPAGTFRLCGNSPQQSASSRTGYASGCSAPFTVQAGKTTTARLHLSRGAAVSGQVLAKGGAPLANVTVYVDASKDVDSSGYTRTDSSGHWRVTGLTTGPHRACFDGTDATGRGVTTGALATCSSHTFGVTQGTVRTGIDMVLTPGGAVSGRLVDADGNPVSYGFVSADDGREDDSAYALADEDGNFAVRGLRAGTYDLCALSAEPEFDTGADPGCHGQSVKVVLGKTRTGITLSLPAPTGVTVSVRDRSGAAVAGVDAVALARCTEDCAPDSALDGDVGVAVLASQVTNAAGEVTLTGLAAGNYAVCLHAYFGTTASGGSPTGYTDTCSPTGSRTHFTVQVVAGQLTAQSFVLDDGGVVTGRVRSASGEPLGAVTVHIDGSAADNGERSSGSEDDFFDFGSGGSMLGNPIDDSVTADDGTYSVIGIRPGATQVCADAAGATGGSSPGGYLDACLPTGSVTVTAGASTAAADLTLARGGAISGRITDSRRSGIGEVDVYVFAVGSSQPLAYTMTDGNGAYSVPQLTTGKYRVCFVGYYSDHGAQCYKNIAWFVDEDPPPLSRAASIAVTAGERRTGIDAVLPDL